MEIFPRYRLTEAEKDQLLLEQAALIERQAARIAELEARLGRPRKTSANSSCPPSQDGPGRKNLDRNRRVKQRPARPGKGRPLAEKPDRTERGVAEVCPHCGAGLAWADQHCRQRYDFIELPPIRPEVTRLEVFGGRCPACGRRYRAPTPPAMAPGTPFGPGIRSVLAYLHHSHHVGFERLTQLCRELFGLTLSEGAIANVFHRLQPGLDAACAQIRAKLAAARVIASDETTTRVNGITHWQWVFVSDQAIPHEIAPSRARAVAEAVLGEHRPEAGISDRYAGQQELGQAHQVCLAHVLRDVQYAIDCGDTVCAPKVRDLLRWTIRVGKRWPPLKDSTLACYAGRAERRLDRLLGVPAAHPAGRDLQRHIKAWRGKFFVFLHDRRVPPTNNVSEREIRPSVVFRKVTSGFRSEWGARTLAAYRSVTGTARLHATTALDARAYPTSAIAVSVSQMNLIRAYLSRMQKRSPIETGIVTSLSDPIGTTPTRRIPNQEATVYSAATINASASVSEETIPVITGGQTPFPSNLMRSRREP